MKEIRFQSNEIVILSGPSSTGKSYLTGKHFEPSQMLSSDTFRYMVSDTVFQESPKNQRFHDGDHDRLIKVFRQDFQDMSEDAFAILKNVLSVRAKYGKLTVVDATSLYLSDIESYAKIAQEQHVPISIVIFDVPMAKAFQFDQIREHPRGDRKLKQQYRALNGLLKSKRQLSEIGVRKIYVIDNPDDLTVTIEENPLFVELGVGLDVMGDGHGLLVSRVALIEKAGYVRGEDGLYRHPDGRKLVYLNDESSRGSLPREDVQFGKYSSIGMLTMMKRHVEAGLAHAVDSNHNYKVWRWLEGRKVTMSHGDEVVVEEFAAFEREYGHEKTEELKRELAQFLKSLPSHLIIADQDLPRAVVVHAGIRDDMVGKEDDRIRDFCRYGPTDGFLENGKPNRLDWTKDHKNGLLVIWGHVPQPEAMVVRDSINLDQGGFCGHFLTMLRYPEMELIQEKVAQSFVTPADNPILQYYKDRFDVPLLQKYLDGFEVSTRFGQLAAHRDSIKSAIEMVSTRTVPMEEMFYVPPTMSPPPNTSSVEGFLEHPSEAFEYFSSKGVQRVVIEKKHMGSRAIIALFRNEEVSRSYFNRPTLGTILSRNNMRFFKRPEELQIVSQLVNDLAPYFDEMKTDFLLLDAEILPWNLKAGELIKKQYGLAANAALYKRRKHIESLQEFQTNRGVDVSEEIRDAKRKWENAKKFHRAFSNYCWNIEGVSGIQIAPFHVLAFSHKTNFDETNEWHMQQSERLSTLSHLVIATPYRIVDLHDELAKESAITWWLETTASGHEGFVFKPIDFVTYTENGDLVQPAIKVRGREYLRIIYGMDYLEPHNLIQVKKRSASKKMRNAIKEFMLSVESVDRFIKKEKIERIHECVLAAMSYESEPMDPRL